MLLGLALTASRVHDCVFPSQFLAVVVVTTGFLALYYLVLRDPPGGSAAAGSSSDGRAGSEFEIRSESKDWSHLMCVPAPWLAHFLRSELLSSD